MTNSQNGCFSGIARILLCKGSHQTHPSDHIQEPLYVDRSEFDLSNNKDSLKFGHEGLKITTCSTSADHLNQPLHAPTNVVARLMGLDTLPATDTNWVVPRRSTSPDSVARSRSVNFMDYLLDLDASSAANHRRINTSVSFREVPSVFNGRNGDLLVLYLDDKEDQESIKSSGPIMRRCGAGSQEMKQKKDIEVGRLIMKNNLKVSVIKNQSRRGPYNSNHALKLKRLVKPINQKDVVVESKIMKKIKKQKSIKSAHGGFEHGSCSKISDNAITAARFKSKKKSKKWSPKGCHGSAEDQTERVRMSYKVAEEEIKKGTDWGESYKYQVVQHEYVEHICNLLGQHILDLLLHQFVAQELMGSSHHP